MGIYDLKSFKELLVEDYFIGKDTREIVCTENNMYYLSIPSKKTKLMKLFDH